MANNHLLIRNTSIYALGDIIPKVLGFIVLPILSDYVLPDQYGIVSYVATVNTFLAVLGLMGLNTYYLVHYYKMPDDTARKALLGNMSIFILGVNVLLSLLLFSFGGSLFGFAGSNVDFYPYLALGVATSFFNSFFVLPAALYRLQERPMLLTVLNIARSVVQTALTLVLVIGYHYTSLGVLWANFIAAAIFGIVFALITARHAIFKVDWPQIKHALRFALPLVPGSIAYYAITMSDRMVIDNYLDLSELGIYGMAFQLALILNIVSYGVYRALEPHFFREFGKPDFERMFKRMRNSFLVLMLFMMMGVGLFAREFFELFAGSAYQTTYYYVPLVMVGIFASAATMLYNTVVTARGRTKVISGITIIGGGASVGLNILLVPLMGLVGACLVSGIVLFGMLGVSIRYAQMPKVDHWRPFLSVALTALALWLGVYVFDFEGFSVRVAIKTVILIVALVSILSILGQTPRNILLTLRSKRNENQ